MSLFKILLEMKNECWIQVKYDIREQKEQSIVFMLYFYLRKY